jgi:hypothetical protein
MKDHSGSGKGDRSLYQKYLKLLKAKKKQEKYCWIPDAPVNCL